MKNVLSVSKFFVACLLILPTCLLVIVGIVGGCIGNALGAGYHVGYQLLNDLYTVEDIEKGEEQ